MFDETYKEYITYGGKTSLTGSFETYFPVPGLKDSDSIRMSTFMDVGGVFDGHISLKEMRASIGMGAMWISPFGPLNISLSMPLNDNSLDKTEPFQFGMGTNF